MRTEFVVSLSDFRYVSIECPHCRTRVTLDMQEKSAFAKRQGIFAPKTCPGCDAGYDTAIQPGIDALQRAYTGLSAIADRITFIGEPVENAGKKDRAE